MESQREFSYVILGSGRQGTAAAYDLAKFGNASKIILADILPEVANQAANQVNQLLGNKIAYPKQLDVTDHPSVNAVLSKADVALSAVPYFYNLDISKLCISTGTSLCDMGGHTGIVRQQLDLDAQAQNAGISLVPDCGMGPGLIVTMAAFAMELLDEAEEIYIYDGGLPQDPQPPWNYQLTFHINGLTNEMDGQAFFIRDGKVVPVDTLSEPQSIEIQPFGLFEADVTSGGLSTSPWNFESKLKTYENRTLRYPGHFEWLRAYKALGLFSEEPITVNKQKIVPRDVFHTLLEPKISATEIRDVCIIRVKAFGVKDDDKTSLEIDLIDYFDEETGFTAMERLTGWHCAIMMGFQARKIVSAGGIPLESAVSPTDFLDEMKKRGIQHKIRYK